MGSISEIYHRVRALATVLVLTPCIVFAADEQKVSQNIDMYVGEVKVLEGINLDRVAIGNGKLLKVNTLPRSQILLIAEGEGNTSLYLWDKNGTRYALSVRITKNDPNLRVRMEKMIYMDVKIIEFRKSALTNMGIDWQKSINGPSALTAGDFIGNPLFRGGNTGAFASLPNKVRPFQTYFGIATEITSRINMLASDGNAYILAEPKLSCKNGGKAKFLAGGELPIPVRGSNGETTVQFKDFGIKLDISPVVDDNGVVSAHILTEVSQVDQSVDVLGVPGFLTRRTETDMNVKQNETIVISGLLSGDQSKDANKLPGLGDIPILGHLFKSSEFRNNRSELVVFVTPRIIDANSELNKKEVERARKVRDERLKQIDERLGFGLVD